MIGGASGGTLSRTCSPHERMSEEQPFPPASVVSSCFPKSICWFSFRSCQSIVFSSSRSIYLHHITRVAKTCFPSLYIYCNTGLDLSYKFGNLDRTQLQHTAPQLVQSEPFQTINHSCLFLRSPDGTSVFSACPTFGISSRAHQSCCIPNPLS